MKKILLTMVLSLALLTANAQQTYVPDDNFEQALINLGYDNVLDDYVATSSIDTITILDVSVQGISDLTGIEDFISIIGIDCSGNNLSDLDLSDKQNLIVVLCVQNQLSSINLSSCPMLMQLSSDYNQLTTLDLSTNYNLRYLECGINQITELDLSNNPNLEFL